MWGLWRRLDHEAGNLKSEINVVIRKDLREILSFSLFLCLSLYCVKIQQEDSSLQDRKTQELLVP